MSEDQRLNTLHEPGDPPDSGTPFASGQLVSMLELVLGGTAHCDRCKRWQRYDSQDRLRSCGWSLGGEGGEDLCPKCAAPIAQRAAQ